MSVRVGVFCGSNVGGSPEFVEHAQRLGSAIARRGLGLVYGGGQVGLMGAVADAVLAQGGEVTGVITEGLVRAEIAHSGLTSLEVVDSMHERKARMVELSSGFVALPGGFGTLDETLEILTWNQLGLVAKPVVFLDVEGYFAGLFEFFDRAVDAKFIRGAHRMLAQRARTVDEAVAIAIAPTPETPHKWIDRDGSFDPTSDLATEVDALFARPADEGVTLALVVVRHGQVVIERYGVRPANLFQTEPAPIATTTPLVSWSVAKSMVHAALGILVGDGRIDPADPAPVPEWAGTEKATITLLDLLEMRSGLQFVEDYVDGESSDVIEMLFGSGATDHAAFAAALPLLHPPGTFWSYASGTTNIICRIIGDLVAGGAGGSPAARESALRAFLAQRLFGPVGMPDADPRFDDAGTWAGSSYVYAPALQFARFAELYLHDGVVGDDRVLPEGWVEQARTVVAADPETGMEYGRHWWVWPDQPGSLAAHGYEGQYVVVLPEHDAVVVHLGKTDAAERDRLVARLRSIIGLL